MPMASITSTAWMITPGIGHLVAGCTELDPAIIVIIAGNADTIYPVYTGPQQHVIGRAMGFMAVGAH